MELEEADKDNGSRPTSSGKVSSTGVISRPPSRGTGLAAPLQGGSRPNSRPTSRGVQVTRIDDEVALYPMFKPRRASFSHSKKSVSDRPSSRGSERPSSRGSSRYSSGRESSTERYYPARRPTLIAALSADVASSPGQESRNSIGRTRRKTLQVFQEIQKDTLPSIQNLASGLHESGAGCGLMTDYLFRLRNQAKSRFPRQLEVLLGPWQLLLTDEADFTRYSGILHVVRQERLHQMLLDDIIMFWKCDGAPEWTDPTHNKTLELAKYLVKMCRMASCLQLEVDNFLARYMLLKRGRGRHDQHVLRREGQVERYMRLQEFWTQAHIDSRKVPPQALDLSCRRSSVATDDGIDDGLPATLSSLPGLLRPMSRGGSRPGSSASRPGSRLTSRPGSSNSTVGSPLWKTRGARSNCSFGGWDWAQGSAKVERTSRPQTPSHRDVRKDVIAGFEPPYWTEEVEPVTPGVGKWWGKGSALSSFLKPKQVKSASLPSLRMGTSYSMKHELWTPKESSRSTASTSTVAQSAFTEPWDTNDQNLKWVNAPSQKYLRACQTTGKSPLLLPFVTGHSSRLEAGGQGLLDGDLTAITKVTTDVHVEDVQLQGNVLLTESSLVPFIESLFGKQVRTINLRRCVQARANMMQTVVDLVADPVGVERLRTLDLSCIPMSSKCHLPLCRAVEAHPSLEDVHLEETGLGGNFAVKECIGALFGCKTLKSLGLAWNCFAADACEHMGLCLLQTQTLQSLDLSNCSAVTKERDITPMVYFMQNLKDDRSLSNLDLSLNRIDYRGALILEDALLGNRALKDLNVSENPMGLLGMRSMLRLLADDSSGVVHFLFDGCSIGDHPRPGQSYFNATHPGGRYILDLSHPYWRAVLRMLYRTCERLDIPHASGLTDMQYFAQASNASSKSSPKNADAPKRPQGFHVEYDSMSRSWTVPDRGLLHVTFSMEQALEREIDSIGDTDFSSFLADHYSKLKRTPGFKKVIPLCALWKSMEGRMHDQLTFLNAMSRDFMLTYPQIKELCVVRDMCKQVLQQLLPHIVGGQAPLFLCTMLSQSIGEHLQLLQRNKSYLDFTVENPTGHYKLDLANPSDYVIAERLMLIDRWEAGLGIRLNRPDISQKGNRSQVRNETYQGNPLPVDISHWTLPDYEFLMLDYSSCKRPPLKASTLDDITFSNILVALQQCEASAIVSETEESSESQQPLEAADLSEANQLQLDALRRISHLVFIRAKQLRLMLGIFSQPSMRIEVCVLLFNRITDMYNEKVFRVRFKPDELDSLCKKIGYTTMFPFIQPEQAVFNWDMEQHDQRVAASLLVGCLFRENQKNTRDLMFYKEDGSIDDFPMGIPRSWEQTDKLPPIGIFHTGYACAPEDRSFKFRREMLMKYGNFECVKNEAQVNWWCSLTDVPQDVLEFVTFLSRRFDDMKQAFEFIDGPAGNKVISLREFLEGLNNMSFAKFKGKQKEERKKTLFRYLDPSGEGQVSLFEWKILSQFWREAELSIREFVSFLQRTLGDDLATAWRFFDEDGSGEIDAHEWRVATRNVGYFGPVMPIFHFLDKDGEGTISADEFTLLDDFRKDDDEDSESGSDIDKHSDSSID